MHKKDGNDYREVNLSLNGDATLRKMPPFKKKSGNKFRQPRTMARPRPVDIKPKNLKQKKQLQCTKGDKVKEDR